MAPARIFYSLAATILAVAAGTAPGPLAGSLRRPAATPGGFARLPTGDDSADRRARHTSSVINLKDADGTLPSQLMLLPPTDPVLALIAARMVATSTELPALARANDANVTDWLGLLLPNGQFADLNYTVDTVASWPAFSHIRRVQDMSATYISPASSYYLASGLLAATKSAFNWWLVADPQNPNW
jgi:hypothetical protein